MRIVSVALFAFLAACAENAPQDTLDNLAGPVAKKAQALFTPVFYIAVAIFFVVEGMLVYALFKFRHRSDREVPVQVHGNKVLEITWTLIPALILAVVAVPTVGTIFTLAAEPKGDVLKVNVIARQWWWEYQYEGLDVVTANELHIPVDRPVRLELRSQDVIHSFWVPRLAGKQDVVPGRTNILTIEADTPGTYLGQCAEFCALSHANMRLRVIAQTASEFDAWVALQKSEAVAPAGGLAARGAELFQANQCIFCHAIRGTKAVGKIAPDLTHLAGRTTFAGATFELTRENLLAWVKDAADMKPGAKMPSGLKELGLSEDDIRAIVEYLLTLK